MTSAAIRDMITMAGNSVGNSLTATAKAAAPGQASFEEVWNSQTEKNAGDLFFGTAASDGGKKSSVENVKEAKVSGRDKTEVAKAVEAERAESKASDTKDVTDPEEIEKLEEAMEVLGSAAMELVQQIADAFGMTVEEVQATMESMGLSMTDLLGNDNLGALILQIGGTEKLEALLTDEDLYLNFKALMAGKEEILDRATEQLEALGVQMPEGVSLEEFAAKLMDSVNAGEEAPVTPLEGALVKGTEPDITVEVQGNEDVDVAEEPLTQNIDEPVLQTKQTSGATGEAESNGSHAESRQQPDGQQGKADTNVVGPQVAQNTQTENANPQVAQTSAATSVWDADTQNIMRQIMDYMRISVKPDMSSLEMQLHPASLGNLRIQLATKEGAISAQFIAQNETVKAALESQMIQLKESFAEQGVKVAEIEVTVQTHEFEQNLEQGRGREQQETSGRNRTRRINLDGFASVDETEVAEEDRLTADMMAASGSSVDYTA